MLAYRRLERIADENDTILDVGTKDGNHLDAITGDVVGVDLKFDFPLRSDISSYMYADGCRLPFESNSFDYIVMNQVFEHVDDRESLITEAARVLKSDGLALFSFPNRFTFNRPHGLPRWLSFLPKAFGKQIARVVLPQKKFEYYATGVFPLSPIGARRLISASFGEIKYVTIDESVESSEIYGNSLAPRLFVLFLPLIHQIAAFPPFLSLFEGIWSYVCYECTSPSG
jgi:SAM-dependent methyltransferase